MTLDEILGNLTDQDRGRWLDLIDPWEGKPVGLRLLVAGPDSATQNKSRISMMDELSAAADVDGRASFEAREKARVNSLARCVLAWEIAPEFGLDARFGHAAVVNILNIPWIQQQVDSFAGDRSHFRSDL